MENKEIIVNAIRACTDRTQVENTFNVFGISSFSQRYDILVEAMYNPAIFFSNENPEDIQKYELALELFLTMEWKYYDAYKRIGAV